MFRKISTNVGSVSTRFRFDGVETKGECGSIKVFANSDRLHLSLWSLEINLSLKKRGLEK